WARAALLGSLQDYPPSYLFVVDALQTAAAPVVRSTAAATLVAMNKSPRFPQSLYAPFSDVYQRLLMESEDPAVLGTIASALADSTLGYDQRINDPSALRAAKKKLQLPEHNEALQSIEAALARIEGREPTPVENAFNHPI